MVSGILGCCLDPKRHTVPVTGDGGSITVIIACMHIMAVISIQHACGCWFISCSERQQRIAAANVGDPAVWAAPTASLAIIIHALMKGAFVLGVNTA